MNHPRMESGEPAFLLAQLGAHAASQFAERLKVLDLASSDAGILRLLRAAPGLSQQELAVKLGIHPSRLVGILDNLQKQGYLERRPNPDDRRLYSLYLTEGGEEILGRVRHVAREHQEALLAPLNSEERAVLGSLLLRLADQHGLTRGVHPGYRLAGTSKRPADKGTQENPSSP